MCRVSAFFFCANSITNKIKYKILKYKKLKYIYKSDADRKIKWASLNSQIFVKKKYVQVYFSPLFNMPHIKRTKSKNETANSVISEVTLQTKKSLFKFCEDKSFIKKKKSTKLVAFNVINLVKLWQIRNVWNLS